MLVEYNLAVRICIQFSLSKISQKRLCPCQRFLVSSSRYQSNATSPSVRQYTRILSANLRTESYLVVLNQLEGPLACWGLRDMHFALPPRKTSHPPPYARTSRTSSKRRKQLQFGAMLTCSALFLIFLVTAFFSSSSGVPAGTPRVVVVTLLDHDGMSKEYTSKIEANRKDYAARHGMPIEH